MRFALLAKFGMAGSRERAWAVPAQILPILASVVKRRSTRIARSIPLLVSFIDRHAKTIIEDAATVSINCHGFQYFSRHRPQKGAEISFQIVENNGHNLGQLTKYLGRVAWVRKSRRLDGLCLVGVELGMPLNIWGVEDVPEDWAAFSAPGVENPSSFLTEVDRILNLAQTANYYQLLGVEPTTSHTELKRHFYILARRFHPDHHMGHPDWTPRLLSLMESLTEAYKTLSDDGAKKEYDSNLARRSKEDLSDARKQTQRYLNNAQECMAERNFGGCILWLHRVIESEPNISSHRTMLGRCLSAIPEYRAEAVEQFEMAIELDPRNVAAHFYFGELLEQMNVPWRARSHYLRVLELDANHWESRQRLNRLSASAPRASSKPSFLGRLTGRR
jgi:curved DNA-binding protein CbpA